MTSTEFAELAKLCQDQSARGSNLLSMAKSLSDQPSPQSELRHLATLGVAGAPYLLTRLAIYYFSPHFAIDY